jgi:hypothetical protein
VLCRLNLLISIPDVAKIFSIHLDYSID